MSLVGTRPPTVDEWELYEPHHRARMSFRPGLTGMWQVSGRSNITDFEEVVKLDTQYISEWSLRLDVKILWKTVWSVLKSDASHNPYYDNGIKLIDCYGEKMPEETLLLVEDYIDGKEPVVLVILVGQLTVSRAKRKKL